jgi:nucleoside-diphosphate-sugar epimerase
MKIIVTGALGHIGSALIRRLGIQFPGSQIIIIDNMLTKRYASLFNLPSVSQYKFIEADLRKVDLNAIFKGAHVVVHLAAITDAAGSFQMSEAVESNNFESTERVAYAALEARARLISLSSTSVYGTQKEVVAEDCTSEELNPQSPYAKTKLKEEALVNSLCINSGLSAISCRFGTIFGASIGMRFHTAVNKFCWQAVLGQPITIWSTAYRQKRPYLDLEDALKAIIFIINENIFNGSVYNILTGNWTVEYIVNSIRKFIPNLETKFVDNEIMNQLSYEVSCEKFRSLGFNFSGDLDRGIGDTISLLKNCNHLD